MHRSEVFARPEPSRSPPISLNRKQLMNTAHPATGQTNMAAPVPPIPPVTPPSPVIERMELFDPSRPLGVQRFSPTRVVTTPNAMALLLKYQVTPLALLVRHVCADWGDCCAQDRALNNASLIDGMRLMSVFRLCDWREQDMMSRRERDGLPTVWAITEHDHSVCTFLLPKDY